MDRRSNPRNKGRPCGGPQGRPTPPPTYHQLQNQLNSAHEYIDELKTKVRSLEENKSQPQVTTENCDMVPKKVQVGRLEELLVTRATDFRQEICHLKKTIQLQQDKYNEMVEKYEAEKEKVQGKVKGFLNLIIERGYEIVDLNSSIDSLTQTLKEKVFQLNTNEAQLQQSKKTWSAKCTALEDRFTKDLAEKEESWETRFNALQTMCNSLQENLKMEQAENKDWQKKANQMEEEKKELEEKFTKDLAEKQQSWENKAKQMEEEKKELEEKFPKNLAEKQQSWENKDKQMEEEKKELEEKFTKDLAEKQRSWEIKDKQVEEEKKELEDLCLKLNEKRRGFFFRKRAGDRQEELEKLKSKMIQKEMKKTEKMEKAEKKKKEAKAAKDRKEKVEEEV